MIHILKSFAAKVWAGAILVVILSGLVVGMLRLLLPLASEFREQLALDLSVVVGAPVRIERLGARLAGLSPELRLAGVEIIDPSDGSTQLHLGEVRLQVDLIESLRSGVPRVGLATIVGARLILRRQLEGDLLLIGLDGDRASNRSYISPEPFFGDGRVRLLDGEIVWDNRRLGTPPLHLIGVDAELINAGIRHQFNIMGQLVDKGGRLEAKMDFFGDPATPADWRGNAYLKANGLDLETLLATLVPDGLKLKAVADIELWSRWNAGRGESVSGQLMLRDLRLGKGSAAAPTLGFERLSTWLDWRREAQGWRLGFKDLRLIRDGLQRPGSDLALRMRQGSDGLRLQAGVDRLWLEDWAAVVTALPGGEDWRVPLVALQPRGELSDFRLKIHVPLDGDMRWQSIGRVSELAFEPWNRVPGVRGLDLAFGADADQGIARLVSDDLHLRFTDLFRSPLQADLLAGSLAWRVHSDGGLELFGDELVLENSDLKTRSRLRMLAPGDGSSPLIDMQTDFADGNGTNTRVYVPVGILSDTLVDWIDRAIVSGHVTSGSFLWRGPSDKFPFRGNEGVFEVLFGVDGLIVDYLKGWPRIEEGVAEILFMNERLETHLHEARLLESRIGETQFRIPDLRDDRVVEVKGEIEGPFADGFRILRETPLAQRYARYVRGMRALGDSKVNLDMSLPIGGGEGHRVDGYLHWDGAGLDLTDWGFTLEQLRGGLKFTDQGVFAQRIGARLWGDPIHVDVDTFPTHRGLPSSTRIDVDLQVIPQRLAQKFPHRLWNELRGSAPGRLSLNIEHKNLKKAKVPFTFRLSSTLQGIEVGFPVPLNKPVLEARRFFLSGSLPTGSGALIRAGYGDIAGTFRLGTGEDGEPLLDGANVSCGTDRPPAEVASGIRLKGRLQQLDLAGWSQWLGAHETGSAALDPELKRPARRVDLMIGEVLLRQGSFKDVKLEMVRTPNAWETEVESARVRGSIRVPVDPRAVPISAHLELLDLEALDAEGEETSSVSTESLNTSWPNPRHAPGLYLDIEKLYIGGRPFGRLNAKLMPDADGLRLRELELDGPLVTVQGSGQWSGTVDDQFVRLSLAVQSSDLGKLTQELQFDSAVEKADMSMQADLRWNAPPLDVNLANLQGTLEFHVGKGRVTGVDPGVGRLFGLLNLGALQRRLTLDFTDLFQEGYSFDRIDGRFSIGDGEAQAEDVTIVGPAADLSISGRTGLLTQDYDQIVTVTPEISTTLPLAGALAGGPVVAAALLLAEQVMGEEVNKLIRYQYRVTGPWRDPQIKRIETQDGWSLSNLLRPAGEVERAAESEESKSVQEEVGEGLFVY